MNETTAEIAVMPINKLWPMYKMLFYEGEVKKDDYFLVKNGKEILFDLREYLRFLDGNEKLFKEHVKAGTISMGELEVERHAFDDEIEERESIMRAFLMDYYKDDGITKPR